MNVEKFSESVANKITGPLPQAGLDLPALIETIMQIVMQLINNCPASSHEVVTAIRSPSRRQRVKFRNMAIETCSACFRARFKSDAGRIADACIAEAATLNDEEIMSVIDDSQNPDFLVV